MTLLVSTQRNLDLNANCPFNELPVNICTCRSNCYIFWYVADWLYGILKSFKLFTMLSIFLQPSRSIRKHIAFFKKKEQKNLL